MPVYEYTCNACEHEFEVTKRITEYQTPEACPECEGEGRRVIRTPVNFNLPGDGWASKNGRIAKQMARKNQRLKRLTEEQKREQPAVTLSPNVDGERTESWADAQKLAASKGKDASSYDGMVKKEQTQNKKIEVTP